LDTMANIQETDRVDELAEKVGKLVPGDPDFLNAVAKVQQFLMEELVRAQTRREYNRAGRIITTLKDIAILKSMVGKPNGDGRTGA
jgi:hypothetical protein